MASERPAEPAELEKVVEEVAREAHVDIDRLRPEEKAYFKEHVLKKPMGVLHIWALGVGVVITGEYFGWNPGLKEGGPIGMLLASLFVCALYMAWVLCLSELSVAILESLFATIGTAIATGGYIFFVINLLVTGLDEDTGRLVTMWAGLATVVIFALVQWVGAGQQAKIMEWMTYGAIAGLVWFWLACIPGVRLERIWTEPLLLTGWQGAIKAIPYAIWWLVMIETVALAPEEAREPHRTIPRGLTLAQITLIVLVILTWFFASAAGTDYKQTGDDKNAYPLPFVYQQVWPASVHRYHLVAFSLVAIFGMVASYNGMIYAVSRQSFSLGRAGYLPLILGRVHPIRRTPDVSIAFWSLVVGGFVVWGFFNEDAITNAVLTCNLTALIWYVLAIICLFVLRIRYPEMARPYKVRLYPILPLLVFGMSLFAAAVYGWLQKPIVLGLTISMYGIGLAYYFLVARTRLKSAAPEELAAQAASK